MCNLSPINLIVKFLLSRVSHEVPMFNSQTCSRHPLLMPSDQSDTNALPNQTPRISTHQCDCTLTRGASSRTCTLPKPSPLLLKNGFTPRSLCYCDFIKLRSWWLALSHMLIGDHCGATDASGSRLVSFDATASRSLGPWKHAE
jgi:hypothetical protein